MAVLGVSGRQPWRSFSIIRSNPASHRLPIPLTSARWKKDRRSGAAPEMSLLSNVTQSTAVSMALSATMGKQVGV